MYRYIFTSSLQRRKSAQSYPYNFIFAVQKKVKVEQIASKTFRLNFNNNAENKPNKYCIQTSKFLLQASRPVFRPQDILARINIEIKMQFIALIPQFQQIKKNKQLKLPINWKTPKLGNALSALKERIVQQLDVFKRTKEKRSTNLKTKNSKSISHGKYWNRQLSAVGKTHYKSLRDLLRLREKILVDRAISLIFWFEVQMERLKTENRLKHISEIRERQESLLLNMHKERQYINRLLMRCEENRSTFPIKAHPEPKQSFGDCFSLFSSDVRKEPGAIGYHNLCLWLLDRNVHKDSRTSQRNDAFKNSTTVEESESEKLKGRAETPISLQSTARTINKNLMDTVEPSENLCDDIDVIPPSQNIETQDTLCNFPNQAQTPSLLRIKGFSMPNQLNLPQKLLYNFNKNESSIIERINEDMTFELIEEHKKVLGQDDSPSNILNSLRWLRCGQNMFDNSPILKSFPRGTSDHIEKVIIYELYNMDVHWENIYTITGNVLEALIDELILQHIKHIAKLFISRSNI